VRAYLQSAEADTLLMVGSLRQGSRARGATLGEPVCRRCGGRNHLIEDDGPPICWICLVAWARFGADIVAGIPIREPGGLELRHDSHEFPLLACPLCRAAGRAHRFASSDGRG
jgi:hypothetical protein